MSVSISVEMRSDQVRAILGRIQKKMADLTPAMDMIGETVQASVQENFNRNGRPPWKALSAVTISRRKRKNARPILQFSGMLKQTINYQATGNQVAIGSPMKYATTHQFGARRGQFGTVMASIAAHVRKMANGKRANVRAHSKKMVLPWGNIPARPFLKVKNRDWENIYTRLLKFITKT